MVELNMDGQRQHKFKSVNAEREQQFPDSEQNPPPEALMQFLLLLCNSCIRIVHRIRAGIESLLTELRLRELANEVGGLTERHPVAAVILAAATVACGIPILIFVAFAIITIFLTFSGFLLIEGTILAGGAIALFACLVGLTMFFTALGIIGAIVYCAYIQVANIVGVSSSPHSSDALPPPHFNRFTRVLAGLSRQASVTNRQVPQRHRHGSNVVSSTNNNGHLHST